MTLTIKESNKQHFDTFFLALTNGQREELCYYLGSEYLSKQEIDNVIETYKEVNFEDYDEDDDDDDEDIFEYEDDDDDEEGLDYEDVFS